jgi:hypothetical protein
MTNSVFQFLRGKSYSIDGLEGIFVVEHSMAIGEMLKFLFKVPSSSRPPNADRSQWGDGGYALMNEHMATYINAAINLGYADLNLRNGLPDPTDQQEYQGALRKEQLRLARPEMRRHPLWKEYEWEIEGEEGQAAWLAFDGVTALQRHFNAYCLRTPSPSR